MPRVRATVPRNARPRVGGRNPFSRRFWLVLGVSFVVAGSIGSYIAASTVSHAAAQKTEKDFVSSSAGVAATLKLSLQHEEDLIASAKAFVLDNPHATEARFTQWAQFERAMLRYPELRGFGEGRIVPAAQLSAFEASMATVSHGAKPFVIIPPGNRSLYCFSVLQDDRNAKVALPIGLDLCAGVHGSGRFVARDTGQPFLAPLTLGKTTTLNIAVPIYQGGLSPTTVAGRRSAFVGWVGMNILPKVIIDTALASHSGIAAELRYGTGTSPIVFHGGVIANGATSAIVSLHNGWTVETFGSVKDGDVFSDANAFTLLLVGIALSLLLGVVIYLLGTGRARAMALVKVRTNQLQYQALHDSLTSLPNRALIIDRMEQMLARAHRNRLPIAAMFLDLDDFKDINDSLGHAAGDELLVAVATRLAATLREGDTVGRLGGDEFVLLIEGASLSAGVEVVADRVLDALSSPFAITASELPLQVTASIGVATGERLSPEELLRDADIALYRAKAAGKRCAVVFAPSMQEDAQDHRHLAVDLHSALDKGEFFLVYQPTIDLQTNAFTGVEALLRWQHPERGVVEPDDFIPALEASGLIISVGAWVLEEACRQGAFWHEQGFRFTVSVNVSAKQLERDRIVDDVVGALSASGFAPEMLILELTETTLMIDRDDTIARLVLLKAIGVRIAVDDFGTGYSSLAYLRKFPIDILKIDRSFVSGIADSAQSSALVHTLVQLGKVLNLETIAEGVEDDDQRLRLQAESVDIGQGFLFSRPLAVPAINRFLEEFVDRSGKVGSHRAIGS
jgi:diguanylate cyclase (GGDEF)-like protein